MQSMVPRFSGSYGFVCTSTETIETYRQLVEDRGIPVRIHSLEDEEGNPCFGFVVTGQQDTLEFDKKWQRNLEYVNTVSDEQDKANRKTWLQEKASEGIAKTDFHDWVTQLATLSKNPGPVETAYELYTALNARFGYLLKELHAFADIAHRDIDKQFKELTQKQSREWMDYAWEKSEIAKDSFRPLKALLNRAEEGSMNVETGYIFND